MSVKVIKRCCTSCDKQKRDRAVYRCIKCSRLLCEHLVGKKHADPEREGKTAGVCSACSLKKPR